ncbi:MAG: ATP-binding protein, partial [Micrococcales bacterium]|nr:ATP-binding protein [Micrococcales bacterium]
ENATAFSEPDTPVVVSTDVVGSFVEVRIVDQGLGMSDDELVAANAKIASTSANDTLGAQRLGLFVVGHLARRLGAEVTLRRNTAGPAGTISSVRFPVTAFQSTEAAPLDVHGDTRRDAPAPETVGAGRAPVRTRLKPPDDFDSILLPDVAVDALPTSLPADDTDWTPAVVDPPLGPEAALPTRRPVASSSAWGSGGAARPRTGGVWLPPTSMPAGTWPVRRQPQVEPWTPPDVEPVPAAGAELNEARAWESGALPVAPVAPSVAPVAAPAAVAAPPAAAPAPAVPAAASPAPEVPSMSAWATPVIPSFGDLVGGPEEPEARRRRGHSGRHDERTDTGHVPVAHPAPAAAPPAVPPLSRQSQTAAYQPDVLADEHRLSRRTPTTVPDETQFVGATVDRDPEALRSRYSSFQSGTTRGRHDAGAAAHREDS